jgi:acyl transferase domain-containing protein/NAD(P)-dependent dehydrogenase (short-subunit alcohol dehydrogenase family)
MAKYSIAIIGMGCIVPKANNTRQFWQNIKDGDSYIKRAPKELWRMECYQSLDRAKSEKSYTDLGSWIEDFKFPFLEYKLPPNALKGVDPCQLVTLEAAKEALKDAGIDPRSDELINACTIVGASGVDGFAHATTFLKRRFYFDRLRPLLKEQGMSDAELDLLLDEFTAELAERGHSWNPSIAAVGAIPSSLSNRVAQVFGVKGFNMTVDAACASSFVAIDTACQALMAGDVKVALAGGSDLGTNPAIFVGFSRVDGLSRSGHSNPFDHTADGLVIGEGVGMVVLKRLEDALADGNHVHAVIRGIGSSSDGAGQAIYAPSVDGRAVALRRALAKAEISSHDVQYLEAHATSTIVGDANEYDAISKVYAPGRDVSNPLYLGSVKHQIGHLKAAAGVAGLIKTVMAMEHGVVPHLPRFTKLTPGAEYPSEALVLPTKMIPWVPRDNGRRIAAITTSGFGGVNYHAIIEQGDTYEPLKSRPKVSRELAIVGVSVRVAGADSPERFWSNVTKGKDVFEKVDARKLGWDYNLDTGPEAERITTTVISRVQDYDLNFLKHKIFPNAVSQISPTQFLALDLADRLLEGYGLDYKAEKSVAVSVGSMHDDYFPTIYIPMILDDYADSIRRCHIVARLDNQKLRQALKDAGTAVKREFPTVTEHTLPGWMTNVTAGRLANKLNLTGPNFTVDTACSSGLASLLPSMYQLMYGDVDMVISGGLNRQLSAEFTSGVCALGAVARDTARPYDKDGAGFLIGEGGVLFLLKRLKDAERDGDDIFAILHNISGSSEADSKTMVAPTEAAVQRAIRNALDRTDVVADSIGVVDTHGSANRLSDLAEARSIARELRKEGSDRPPVEITAIKSHIGHLYGGSGASSTLSTIMSLRSGQVPGIRNLENIRPELEEFKGRAIPRKGTSPLHPSITAGGVCSLGLGGANYFAVVSVPESARQKGVSLPEPVSDPTSINGNGNGFVGVRRNDREADNIFVCVASREQDLPLALWRALQKSPVPAFFSEGSTVALRLTATYENESDLRSKLQSVLRMLEAGHDIKVLESQGIYMAKLRPGVRPDRLAFCFPGQGVHYISMGRHLYEGNSVFRETVDAVHEATVRTFNFDLLGHIYGDPEDNEIKEHLGTLVGAQTALFAIELGVANVLTSMGVKPDVMIGHSFGEISALTVAGVWDIDTAIKVVEGRIKSAELVIKGKGPRLGMASVICSEEQRDAILDLTGGRIVLTNVNAPSRYVFAGEYASIEHTVKMAETFGANARILPIGAAFHSHYMEPARAAFRKVLRKLPCSPPQIPILSTVTGEYIEPGNVNSAMLADHLSSQLVTKLNLVREVSRLYRDGIRNFLEVGPGWAMTNMIKAILEGRSIRAVPSLHPKVGDVETHRRAMAFLIAHGHLPSAADRRNLPGMFTPDFLQYMQYREPAILSVMFEVQKRFIAFELDKKGPGVQISSSRQALTFEPPPVEVPVAPELPPVSVPSMAPVPSVVASAPAVVLAPVAVADVAVWAKRLKVKLVETTGYPEEMLEEHLDLEADLGVDSVQRAEIWTTLLSEHGLDPDARPEGPRTIANLAENLVRMGGGGSAGQEVTAPVAAPSNEVAAADVAVWAQRLKTKLVETTGYPEEMLEEHLDLEADLGVDSVQRAEIWTTLLGEHGLDPDLRPEGARTIANLAENLTRMSGGGTSPASTVAPIVVAQVPGAEASVWAQRLKTKLVETTGYPEEMLEEHLDLEADLGVDSVQRAEIWTTLLKEHDLDPDLRPEGARTIANLANNLASFGSPAAPVKPVEAVLAPSQQPVAVVEPGDAGIWAQRLKSKLVETTGYPEEMLEEHLDLEADLGVDSVQRAEIWTTLLREHGLDPDLRPEGARTIANLADHLARFSSSAGEGVSGEAGTAEPIQERDVADEGTDNQLFVSSVVPMDPALLEKFECKRVLLILGPRKTWSVKLVSRLEKQGIVCVTVCADELALTSTKKAISLVKGCDTVIYAAHDKSMTAKPDGAILRKTLKEETSRLFGAFRTLVPLLQKNPLRVMVPVTLDGAFGAHTGTDKLLASFPSGFVRSLHFELPDCHFQLIDGGKLSWSDTIVQYINKLGASVEMGNSRLGPVIPCVAPLGRSPSARMVPDQGDLVFVTGGARGIVFECVLALARQTGCQLLLTGRTHLPEGKPEWLGAGIEDIDRIMRELEIGLVRSKGMSLGNARRESARARTQWELTRNLSRLKEEGIEASYAVCDVGDAAGLQSLLEETMKTQVIAGVVHGAGVQKSHLIMELKDDQISQTIDTKLDPLFTMLDVLDWSAVKLFSGFGSITGLFGNAGQTDYALANDLLTWFVKGLAALYPHAHCQTIEWTAWTGTGMVTDAEAQRFAESGLVPVPVEAGVKLFLQGVLGSVHTQLAAFNTQAAIASTRPVSRHFVSARSRPQLLDDRIDGRVTATLVRDMDVYLDQHKVNGEPVAPGTFVTEMFAEAVNGDGQVLKKVRFRRPLAVREDSLSVEVVKEGKELLLLPANRPELGGKGLANLSYASCSLGKKGKSSAALLKCSDKVYKNLVKASREAKVPFYSMLDQNFSHALDTGPIFRGILATLESNSCFHAYCTLTPDAAAITAVPGDFVINPVVADMAVQVASAWSMMTHKVMAIPFEIGTLHVADGSLKQDAVVICRAHESTPEQAVVDVAVRDLDGTLLFAFDKIILKTIARIED